MTDEFGSGQLSAFAESVWTAATPIRFAGIWFPHVMTVVRRSDGGLVLHSPCRPSQTLTADIAALGPVAHVVAPNWFHDLYLAGYRSLYPKATFWAPVRLRRGLGPTVIDHVLDGTARPPWFADMPHLTLSGLLTFDESIFFHAPSRTLIVADLLMNLSASVEAPGLTRFAYRFSGIQGKLMLPPYVRWFGVGLGGTLRGAARQIQAWNPERLIVGHGAPIGQGAMARLHPVLEP
jgi:hypothetical protein